MEGQAVERFVLATQHIAEIKVVLVQVAGVVEGRETAEEFLAMQHTTETKARENSAGGGEDSERQEMVIELGHSEEHRKLSEEWAEKHWGLCQGCLRRIVVATVPKD